MLTCGDEVSSEEFGTTQMGKDVCCCHWSNECHEMEHDSMRQTFVNISEVVKIIPKYPPITLFDFLFFLQILDQLERASQFASAATSDASSGPWPTYFLP
jgi:hypothetical protein